MASMDLETLNRWLAEEPDNPEWFRQRAEWYRQASMYGPAIEDFRDYLAVEHGEPGVWLDLAACLQEIGHLAATLDAYDQYLAICPDDLDVRTYRVQVLCQHQRYPEAITEALSTIRQAEQSEGESSRENLPLLWLLIARSQAGSGQARSAIQSYTLSLELDPEQADIYVERGRIFHQLGESAKAHLDAAAAQKRRHPEAEALQRLLDTQTAESENPEEALERLDAAIREAPADSALRLERGALHHDQERWAEAITDFTAVLRTDPDNLAALDRRAATWLQLELYNRAILDCRGILTIDRGSANAFRLGAIATWRKGQAEQAVALARKALSLGSTEARGLLAAWTDPVGGHHDQDETAGL